MKPLAQLTDDEFAHHVHRAVRELPDAPLPWQEAAVALWPAVQAPLTGVAQALGRFVQAALTFDSWATPGLAHGMRSTRAPTRHLLYSAQGCDIDLRIRPAPEHFSVSGQILGPDAGGQVELVPAGPTTGPSHSAALDEMGEFRITGVPSGRYLLTLRLGAQPIIVQPFDVGEAVT